ncbi:hypothetical protein PHYSODRAFT_262495 [Phytophthora sojae]|uniref:Uncharacterized protein n=1 Tax=Phytophthora sojae (strain P6497) TaxID=1094619 RepID=G4ZHG4_PHYSP|nr:hypothetical protein PHYSODRAFT_262495 [Phytophthora sojae]EGZ17634.1 hypothetical protein PHYSODRAFT_262495 [Phytophthora sojae]|eukprot:XP_009526692.1 hypothetical protein PHYSODRAFT_262495 [Phytophthora sojae]
MAVAGVRTVNGVDLWYDAATRVCTTFSHCSAWANSERVNWRVVPGAVSIWFYSDDDCKGKIVFASPIGQASGTSVLTSSSAGVAIRSLMAVGTSMDPLRGVVSECYFNLNDYHERSDVINGSTSANFSGTGSQSGDISANWHEPLPHN